MMKLASCILGSLVLFGAAALSGQATESSIAEQVDGLRALPDAQRWLTTAKIAMDIRTLPAGLPKLRLADALAHLSTEGDPGRATLQAVADTLAQALKETPQPADADGDPAAPYTDLAKLVRYEGVTADLGDPMLAHANEILAANDADVAKADFTLQDLRGKEYTLSALKGKMVLVNFWATWCPPCRKEMKDLDSIYTRYRSRGLVILSITSEEPDPVMNFLSSVRLSSACADRRRWQRGETVSRGWAAKNVCLRSKWKAGAHRRSICAPSGSFLRCWQRPAFIPPEIDIE